MINLIIIFLLCISISVFHESSDIVLLLLLGFMVVIFLINQHLTIMLIQLEILSLLALSLLVFCMGHLNFSFSLIYMVMVVAVIEASIGLGLLVKQTRNSTKELTKFNLYLKYSI